MDRDRHLKTIRTVLAGLNSDPSNPYILKGGTALVLCYGLDRFSEDVDLDAARSGAGRRQFFTRLRAISTQNGWQLRVAKDTLTVQRAFIHYSADSQPLKIELSRRTARVPEDSLCRRNGYLTYTIGSLCMQKITAYLSRSRIRDLYDLCFIYDAYRDILPRHVLEQLTTAFTYQGIDQFDYLVRTQADDLIGVKDRDVLVSRFLEMYADLGLIDDDGRRTAMRRRHGRSR